MALSGPFCMMADNMNDDIDLGNFESHDEWNVEADDRSECSSSDLELQHDSDVEGAVHQGRTSFRFATLNIGLGLRRKLATVLQRAVQLRLDVLALQEIGVGADATQLCSAYDYRMIVCGHEHAGTALLIRTTLWHHVRKQLVSGTDGRLAGAELEFNGHQLIVVSAYMPSGLDSAPEDSEQARSAVKLYAQLLGWMNGAAVSIVLGDLNETASASDRTGRAKHHGRFLNCLKHEGFRDAYRSLSTEPGFTYRANAVGGQVTMSRLDYVFTKGDVQLQSAKLDAWNEISQHRTLCVSASLSFATSYSQRTKPQQLPDLRRATAQQRAQFAHEWQSAIADKRFDVADWSAGDAEDMNRLSQFLLSTAMDSARATLRFTGQPAFRTRSLVLLERERQALVKLRACARQVDSDSLQLSRRWKQCSKRALRFVRHSWGQPWLDKALWLSRVSRRIAIVRREVKRERKRLRARLAERFVYNSTASLHRLLRGDRDAAIDSVIDPVSNKLVTDGESVKRVLRDHFATVFRSACDSKRHQQPNLQSEVFEQRVDIDPSCYARLMQPVTVSETVATLKQTELCVAPGRDCVSVGVLRIGAERSDSVRWAITLLLNACLRLRRYPDVGRHSVIVPILKKAHAERTMSNVRPISLQSALSKLLSKIIASRLADIFKRHRILDIAQEGFVLGGSTNASMFSWMQWSLLQQMARTSSAFSTTSRPRMMELSTRSCCKR
jgi:exonuclease III